MKILGNVQGSGSNRSFNDSERLINRVIIAATRFCVPGCLDAFSPEGSGFTRPLYAIRDGARCPFSFHWAWP